MIRRIHIAGFEDGELSQEPRNSAKLCIYLHRHLHLYKRRMKPQLDALSYPVYRLRLTNQSVSEDKV